MPTTSALLAQLEALRLQRTPGASVQLERLLAALERREFDDASLIRFHDAVLFLRAFPAGARIRQKTESILKTFAGRVAALKKSGNDLTAFDPESVSGIAGTEIVDTFNYEVTRWLARRYPGRLKIEWDYQERTARLGLTLPRFVPLLEDDAMVEADVPFAKWVRAAAGKRDPLAWLLRRFEGMPLSDKEKAEIYDSLELPVAWTLGNSASSRTRAWRPVREFFYHPEPLLARRDVSLQKELAAPIRLRRLLRREAGPVLDMCREATTVRYRELYGITRGDAAQVVEAAPGRGVQIFLWGLPRERRLPLRAYCAGFTLKNGVPVNYIEAIGLADWIEVGFNTFYSFRDGETAWIYAQALRALHALMGATCISVYPYQLGQDNEEAIQSGAFWFYRKLGFRPGRRKLLRLTEKEEARIAADASYRTPARILRKVAQGHVFYEFGESKVGEWDRFSTRKIGMAVGRRMAARFDGDAEKMRRECRDQVARALSVRVDRWDAAEREAFDNFALVLAMTDVARWSAGEKRETVRVIRAKTGKDEWGFMKLLRGHERLRRAMIETGSDKLSS